MPAKKLLRTAKEGTYSHIYNRGIEKRVIFETEEDYEVFLGFLNDYLTAPDPESNKKVFTINDRTFRGIPHQPKNYFEKVELIAYSLMPDHFHLLLHQKTPGAIEGFIRSLCTRYSMYFNKKYHRTGALFQGPYKSLQIKDASQLLHLTRYLHRSSENGEHKINGYSSYSEYLGARVTSWVTPRVILSFFDKSENNSFKGVEGYKNFVEKYTLTQKEEELLEGITLEDKVQDGNGSLIAGSSPATDRHLNPTVKPETLSKPSPRIFELATAGAIFLLLLGLGLRNISISKAESQVLSNSVQSTTSPEPIATPAPKTMVVVKITDGSTSVNIRQEPTIRSEKIGQALDGEIFEFVSINSSWYEVKLFDGSTGFISATYAFLEDSNN